MSEFKLEVDDSVIAAFVIGAWALGTLGTLAPRADEMAELKIAAASLAGKPDGSYVMAPRDLALGGNPVAVKVGNAGNGRCATIVAFRASAEPDLIRYHSGIGFTRDIDLLVNDNGTVDGINSFYATFQDRTGGLDAVTKGTICDNGPNTLPSYTRHKVSGWSVPRW